MMQDYRQNQIETLQGDTEAAQAVRLLQVLNGRAQDVQGVTTNMFEMATMLPFSDYTDGFRRVQEFLSFCDVIESKLEHMVPRTRDPILHEVTAVKMRAIYALLRAMGAYLLIIERRGVVNFFAQAVFLMQHDTLSEFDRDVLAETPAELVPAGFAELSTEVQQRLKRLIERSIEIPDFRFPA